MKSILTIVFVIFFGVLAQAHNNGTTGDVVTVEMSIAQEEETKADTVKENTLEVTRLYRRSNSKVKKALAFTTKRNRAKMA